MKAITANPETVREVFTKKYVIPHFQRPYSWDNDTCEKMWDDITNFIGQNSTHEDKYFLGNIVINPSLEDSVSAWEVVDGQQRLTTLLLLIKALHTRAGTVKALEECLRIKDPLTSELTGELRVNSCVISADKEHLQRIINNDLENMPECPLWDNYNFLCKKIDEWWHFQGQGAEALNHLILTLLDHVVLLPIHCGSEDDALTIFETINNRGMSLSDSDIFKAKLYQNINVTEQNQFIADWNELKDHEWLFRVLMHILRARAGDSGKEIGMRAFFTAKDSPLMRPGEIMRSLKVIHQIYQVWYGDDEVNALWNIMETYPNYYWNFPLAVFLHKYGVFDENTWEFSLPEAMTPEFHALMNITVKFFFIKGIVYNTVNAVRDAVYRICVEIEKEGDYLAVYRENIQQSDWELFSAAIAANHLRRYQRGMVLLSAYLNPAQDKGKFSHFFDERYDIEHILPKKWNHYDGWTDVLWEEQLNTLGNLIPLSRTLNIMAQNEFFDRKKVYYKESVIQDALDLAELPEWTPETLTAMQEVKVKRLLDYCGMQRF